MPFAKTECICIVCGKRFISGSCRGKFCGDRMEQEEKIKKEGGETNEEVWIK